MSAKKTEMKVPSETKMKGNEEEERDRGPQTGRALPAKHAHFSPHFANGHQLSMRQAYCSSLVV